MNQSINRHHSLAHIPLKVSEMEHDELISNEDDDYDYVVDYEHVDNDNDEEEEALN
jgi:hypothetical protein